MMHNLIKEVYYFISERDVHARSQDFSNKSCIYYDFGSADLALVGLFILLFSLLFN
jgi:hypothetical protein